MKNLLILLSLFFVMCNSTHTPKPMGYIRIDFPEKKYKLYSDDKCPYQFECPVYANVTACTTKNAEPCWKNIEFPQQRGTIYLSYNKIDRKLSEFTEDSRQFAMKHIAMAEGIDEQQISIPKKKVYGMIYNIEGNTASSIQFYLTDSTTHFLRGALYFNSVPNIDSLAPVIAFVRTDIMRMIETLEWKK